VKASSPAPTVKAPAPAPTVKAPAPAPTVKAKAKAAKSKAKTPALWPIPFVPAVQQFTPVPTAVPAPTAPPPVQLHQDWLKPQFDPENDHPAPNAHQPKLYKVADGMFLSTLPLSLRPGPRAL
jgi:hypothetical protein